MLLERRPAGKPIRPGKRAVSRSFAVIRFSLPELALYKFQKQSGYARLHVDIFDNRTGEFVGSSATIIGRTYYDQYTVLFYFTWAATDLLAPP